MPPWFTALDEMKNALLLDGQAKLTEAEAMEWALADQVAQRRRIAMYKGEKAKLSEQMLTRPIKPADLHGLSPADMLDVISGAVDKKVEDNAFVEQEAYRQRADAEERAYADELAARQGLPPGSVILGDPASRTSPAPDENVRFPVQRPAPYGTAKLPGPYGLKADIPLNHPAEERYGRLDDIRIATDDNAKFYGGLARGAEDPFTFARVLAGQLTAQRMREMGPDQPDAGMTELLYLDTSKLPVY